MDENLSKLKVQILKIEGLKKNGKMGDRISIVAQ